jgi:Fur family iron response transcriptional regulator
MNDSGNAPAGSQPANARAMTRESVAERLHAHDITPTHQRIEIARVLLDRGEHLSADQILALVNAQFAETSKATVYNTLKLFLEKKLIRELIIDPTRVVYDPNTTPHHHFYDSATGRLTDIPADDVRVMGLPPLPPGVVAEAVDIIVRTRSQD